jgi:hypothetical protein
VQVLPLAGQVSASLWGFLPQLVQLAGRSFFFATFSGTFLWTTSFSIFFVAELRSLEFWLFSLQTLAK